MTEVLRFKVEKLIQGEPTEYAVIIDRISHEVDYYRGFLKLAVLNGTYVINNPFWWTADDKFFGASLAAVPATLDARTYWEILFWGGGHALQFTWTLLMLVGWLWLAAACGALSALPLF